MNIASIWQILISGVTTVLIGMIWYHPRVFGTAWTRLAEISPAMVQRSQKRTPIYIVIALLAGMLVAWVMNSIGVTLGIYDWVGAVFELALWTWLGFVIPTSLNAVLWEHRPLKLYLINAGYWLVSFCAIALVLIF